jgi:hypothetical protein
VVTEGSSRLAHFIARQGAEAIDNAVSESTKDGLLAAVDEAKKLVGSTGSSKATFFATQKNALDLLELKAQDGMAGWHTGAKGLIRGYPAEVAGGLLPGRADLLEGFTIGARVYRLVLDGMVAQASQFQYNASLREWMTATARGELGARARGDTDIGKALHMSPRDHYDEEGSKGVVYVAFGQRRDRPLGANSIKIGGITSAVLQRIQGKTINDLGFAVVASGYLVGGFLDALSVALGDNEIAFGRNESGHVSVYGHDDAMDRLKEVTGASSAAGGAEIVLKEDIGTRTLAGAHLEK